MCSSRYHTMMMRLRIEKLVCALMFYYRLRSGKVLLLFTAVRSKAEL